MAHPLYAVEQALNYYKVQWHAGLKPFLVLRTQHDGSISVTSKVTVAVPQMNTPTALPSQQHQSSRSGNRSRHRRKLLRQKVSNVENFHTAEEVFYNLEENIQTSEDDILPLDKIDVKNEDAGILRCTSSTSPVSPSIDVSCPPLQSFALQPQPSTDISHNLQTSATVNEVKYCDFCDQEFATYEAFMHHMKQAGFICNNCLDFFSDNSWFPEAEAGLTFIRKGAILSTTLVAPILT